VDYFSFSECLGELVESGHLEKSTDGLYGITERGRKNSEICESSLPYAVRAKAEKNITAYNRQIKRKGQVRSSVTQRPNGAFTVTLSLCDDVDELLSLDLMVAREDMAQDIAARFQAHAEEMYNGVLDVLLETGEE
jgi:hypothetical protein